MPESSQNEKASPAAGALLGAGWFAAGLLVLAGEPLSPILSLAETASRPHWLLLQWLALLWVAFIRPLESAGRSESGRLSNVWLIPALLALPVAVVVRLEPVGPAEWAGAVALFLAVTAWSGQLERWTSRAYYPLQTALFFLPPLLAFYQAELVAARLGEFSPQGAGRLVSPLAAAANLAGEAGGWVPTALAYAAGAAGLILARRIKRRA